MSQNKPSPPPKWVQLVSGIALLAVALTAAGISLAVNVEAGLMVGIPLAVIFGLSDVGKILAPVICQAIGWTRHLKATYLVASSVSVLCALLAMADYFGAELAKVNETARSLTYAEQRVSDLRKSLQTVRTMAAEEAQRGGCGPNCKALNDRAAQLETRLTDAVRARQSQTEPTVTGKGFLAHSLISVDPSTMDTLSAVALTLAWLLIMELMAHTAGSAASMIGYAMKPRYVQKVHKSPKPKKPAKRKSRRKPDWTKPDAYSGSPVRITRKGTMDKRYKSVRASNDNPVA